MWRQGDIYIARANHLPERAVLQNHLTLAEGEVTGHSHRVAEGGSAQLHADADRLYLHVGSAGATIVHDEHGPIVLEPGIYRVWRQREYTTQAIRTVLD